MSRCCELTGKSAQNGNRVSHSCIKTAHKFQPNLQTVGFFSESLGKKFSFKIATSTIRTIVHNNGLDNFLLKQKNTFLSKKAIDIKKMIASITKSIPAEENSNKN